MSFTKTQYILNDKFVANVKVPVDVEVYPITKIEIGGPKRTCIILEVSDRNENTAYLSALGHDAKCILNGTLAKGDGTIELLKTAMVFVLNQYPHLEGIELRDKSHILCQNKQNLSLHFFSIAVNGKTWYHRMFNAKLVRKDDRKKYKQMRSFLDSEIKSLQQFQKDSAIPSELLAHYKPGDSYSKLFKRIRSIHVDCSVFTPWLDTWFRKLNFYRYDEVFWLIKRRHVESYPQVSAKKKNATKMIGGRKQKRAPVYSYPTVGDHRYI